MTTGPSGQLPLALRHSPDQRFETYVDAPAGALAQLRALATAAGADGLYLAGPAGVGKTHLALAACAAADAAGRRAAYLPLASARGRLRTALDALDGYDLVALDGVQAIAGDREDEVALFDFHNRARASPGPAGDDIAALDAFVAPARPPVRAAGTALLYTAEVAPDALALVLPDLRSRLAQCTRIVLAPLDDDGRRRVLRERAQRRGLVLEDAALEWLLRRVGRDLAGLTALLDRLDRASLAAQRRVTVPFLRDTLGPR